MSADGWRDDLEQLPEECASCRLELPRARDHVHRIGGKTYCQTCWGMFESISENEWMKTAQQEYRQEQQNLKKLKPGEDYFK